jgi:mannose-6-phosphate isomerase-like protein (cupin superfamily)
VVYEGQGDPFAMKPSDFVLQPPLIRHRVLESSPGLEVVEITAPAMHETFAEHAMELPNGVDESLVFGDQRFLRHIAAETPWTPFAGGEAQETRLAEASGGMADARTIRACGELIHFAPHDGELVFGFVLDGTATLDYREQAALRPGDSFVIPPNEAWSLTGASADFRLLHVTTAPLD